MPGQHGQLANFKIGKVFPSTIKIPGGASVEYITTLGGFVVPRAPLVKLAYVSNGAVGIGATLALVTGVANTVTLIKKVWLISSVAARVGLMNNAVQIGVYRTGAIATIAINVIDLGPEGSEDFCIAAGDVFGISNLSGAAMDMEVTVFGSQFTLQT